MSKLNQTPSMNKPTGGAPASGTIDIARRRRRTIFIAVAVSIVLALIAAIVGVSYYFSEDAKYNRLTVITVDDISIKMDYFLRRARLTDDSPMDMLQTLTDEQLIKIEAPRYVGEASPEDVDQILRLIAGGEDETISESEFKEWYRQLLNEIDLSDSEYSDMVATTLLTTRLQAYLAERVPTVAEQVYLYSVVLSTDEAMEIWGKEDAGEDTEELISEIWQDRESTEEVYDIGWTPRGILPYGFDDTAFSLAVGDISEPMAYVDSTSSDYDTYYYLLMVSEKAEAREIDEEVLQALQSQVIDDWLLAEKGTELHNIAWHGIKNGFGSETIAWINYQLAKE